MEIYTITQQKFLEVLNTLNLHPDLYKKIFDSGINVVNMINKVLIKRWILATFMNGGVKQGRGTANYWKSRGWSEYEAMCKSREYIKIHKKKTISPFSYKFWLLKINEKTGNLYTEEEAKYKIKSLKPVYMEFWLEKGLSEQEAILKAADTHENNSKMGTVRKMQKYDKNDIHKMSQTSMEYWIYRGYTPEQAEIEVKKRQSTFSLEKCITKYGEEQGQKVWRERQEKWQESLKKTYDYSKNSCYSMRLLDKNFDNDISKYVNHLNKTRGMSLVSTLMEFDQYVNDLFECNPQYFYYPLDLKIKLIPNIQYELLDIDPNEYFNKEKFIKTGKYKHGTRGWTIWIDEGYLRSTKEYYMYTLLKKHNISFVIEKPYLDSKMRCDFYLVDYDVYVEICGQDDENYINKMNKKKELFNCTLLWTKQECDSFVGNLL